MSQIKVRLKELEIEKSQLLRSLEEERGRKRFLCGCCQKLHAIKDCHVIQTHWYTSPRGCTEGDYWSPGELQVICPTTDHKNRIHFDSHYQVEYRLRADYDYSAEAQFKRLYKHLFKSVIDDYDRDKRKWVNLTYFDEHRSRFDLHVKGLDPERQDK
jgi:hypothetical protein